jgi:23S rRNA pseudouridine1911/1915/1917 synthase
MSWREAREACLSGRVRVDGLVVRDSAARPREDANIEVEPRGAAERADGSRVVRIVSLDQEIVVVSKPAGILTVPFEDDDRDTLLALTRVAVGRRERARKGKLGANPPPNPTLRAVQRLDKETSGLVVFARTIPAQRGLQAQFADEHEHPHRLYWAITTGETRAGVRESWFVRDRGDGLRGSWRGSFRESRFERSNPPEGAKRAVTRIEVIERLVGATLVTCALETGRTHQIRIHLAESGTPVAGEMVYIRERASLPAPRPMLHAAELGFTHPRDGRSLHFEEPLPADFADYLAGLRAKGKP